MTHTAKHPVTAPRVRILAIGVLAVAALQLGIAAPAHAAVHRGLTIKIPLPVTLATLTIHDADLGVAVSDEPSRGSTAYRISIGHSARHVHARPTATRSTAIVRTVHAAPRAAAHGPLAVTAAGLISVVPLGPMPTALRPHVARSRFTAQRAGSGATGLPAPPVGFWFALVMLVLLLGTTTFRIGGSQFSASRIAS